MFTPYFSDKTLFLIFGSHADIGRGSLRLQALLTFVETITVPKAKYDSGEIFRYFNFGCYRIVAENTLGKKAIEKTARNCDFSNLYNQRPLVEGLGILSKL